MAYRYLGRTSRLGSLPSRRTLEIISRRYNFPRFYTSAIQPDVNRSHTFGSTKSLIGLTIGKKARRAIERTRDIQIRNKIIAKL
jgi:hypothetical protein